MIAIMYTPDTTTQYEKLVAQSAVFPAGWPLDSDFIVELDAYHPNNVYGDLDNIAKSVLDGLNNHGGAWTDDKQVSGLYLRRGFDDANPRVEVRISAIPAQKHEKVKTSSKRRATVEE